MVRKNLVKFLVVLMAVWVVGGCAKKVMPPEVDAGPAASEQAPAAIAEAPAAGGSGFGSAPSNEGQEARSLDFQPTTDLGDVFFAYDKYDLDETSKKALQKNADWLKQHPGAKIQIEGHCDERGTNNYNLALGERRALSTKKFLMALGVDEKRVYTISYGEEKPFCMEHKESCWKQNRRGRFLVSK